MYCARGLLVVAVMLGVALGLSLWPNSSKAQGDDSTTGQQASEAEASSAFQAYRDDFEGELRLDWRPVRHDPSHVSLAKRPGMLTITTQRGSIHGDEDQDTRSEGTRAKNLFLFDNPSGESDFVVTTCVDGFEPVTNWQQAGLILYDDDDNYTKWVWECGGRGQQLTFLYEEDEQSQMSTAAIEAGSPRLWLRLTKRGNLYEYASSNDGETFTVHGELPWRGHSPNRYTEARFSAERIGLIAKNGGNASAGEIDACFDFFSLRPLSEAERNEPRFLERQCLAGTWDVLSCETNGKPLEEAPLARFVFSMVQVTMVEQSRYLIGDYRIDLSKTPKEVVSVVFTMEREGTSGELHGVYSLDGDDLTMCLNLSPGGPSPTELKTQESDGHILITLKRQSASWRRTVRIHVLNPDGQPMPGAKIHASVWTKEPFKANRDYVCDAGGQTVVELPQAMDILRLWAREDGYVPLFANWERDRRTDDPIPEEYTFHLPEGTVIGGLVRDEDGQPIEGATVEVMRVSSNLERERSQRPRHGTWLAEGDAGRVTDADGRWTLDNVPEGDDIEVRVKLSHPDYINDFSWGQLQNDQNVTLQSLREKTATIVMRRGISITGTVTDPEGKPVSGAVVVWGADPYLQTGSQEVRTNDAGVYRFPPLPPGPMIVTVVAQGWAPDLKEIEVSPENPPVDFHLQPGKSIRIQFVDGSGSPLPEVHVGIQGWRGIKSLYNHKHPNVLDTLIPLKADKSGVYSWTWAPEHPVAYSFYKEGYQSVREMSLTAAEDEHKITLQR